MSDPETLYPPGEAKRLLGCSGAALRRMAADYETVHGDLPRNDQGHRLFPAQALERLDQARRLRDAGGVQSLEVALHALNQGVSAPPAVSNEEDELLEAVRSLTRAVGRLEAEISELKAQQKALEPPAKWWQFWKR